MAEPYLTIGGPGAGKTTFIAHEVERALAAGYGPDDVDIRSLTRAAAKQAAGKIDLPEHRIGTLHSAAFRALGLSKSDVAESKVDGFNEHTDYPVSGERPDLDDAAPVEAKSAAAPGDVLHARMNVLRARRVPREEWTSPDVREHADRWFSWMEREGLVDFPGMLEKAIETTHEMPGNPGVMFVDEAQDLPRLGLDLVEVWAERADKLILVGDPVQCIYGWAGSDPRALSEFIPPGNRRMLKRSYRVPRRVWEWAADRTAGQVKRWGMEGFQPRDENGAVTPAVGGVKPSDVMMLVDMLREEVERGREVMILATCAYMLNPVIKHLRDLRVPFANPWRPTRGDWNPLHPRRTAKLLDFMEGPQTDVSRMAWLRDLHTDDVLARGVKTKLAKGVLETPHDFAGWCALFREEGHAVKALGERSLDWLEANLTAVSGPRYDYLIDVARRGGAEALRERPKLFVGTVHSVKGGEADSVFILPELSPKARQQMAWGVDDVDGGLDGRAEGDDRLESIERVFYVAATRAREEVRLCAGGKGSWRW